MINGFACSSSLNNSWPKKQTRSVMVGSVGVGGEFPCVVQSMTNTDTRNIEKTLEQITQLADAGCELVRLAVLDLDAAMAIKSICLSSPIPVIADIHFDANLAVKAIEGGAKGLRINPGNIGGKDKVFRVVDAAKLNDVNIRIGVNSGSLEKDIAAKYGGVTSRALAESAFNHIKLLEERKFYNIKVSLKSSSVIDTVFAYREISKLCNYPLHIGITEAGTLWSGTIKSSVGLGILLSEGLGDTIRVSLTHDPVKEVDAAWQILRSLGLRKRGPEVISCPTCGRTEIDLIELATKVEERIKDIKESFTIAVMGCVVNGPGEAKSADVGIAGGRGKGVLFRKGKVVGSVTGDVDVLLDALMQEIQNFLKE